MSRSCFSRCTENVIIFQAIVESLNKIDSPKFQKSTEREVGASEEEIYEENEQRRKKKRVESLWMI